MWWTSDAASCVKNSQTDFPFLLSWIFFASSTMSWTFNCPSHPVLPFSLFLALETEWAIPVSRSSLFPGWIPFARRYSYSFCCVMQFVRGREANFLPQLWWLLFVVCRSTSCLVDWYRFDGVTGVHVVGVLAGVEGSWLARSDAAVESGRLAAPDAGAEGAWLAGRDAGADGSWLAGHDARVEGGWLAGPDAGAEGSWLVGCDAGVEGGYQELM